MKRAEELKQIAKRHINSQGLTLHLVEYRNDEDIDVKSNDGTLFTHQTYSDYISGNILHPTLYPNKDENGNSTLTTFTTYDMQRKIRTCVYTCKCYNCRKTYKFTPSQMIAHSKICLSGTPRIKPEIHPKIGETVINKQGQKVTIIKYQSYGNIDVQLENGEILCNKTYQQFESGNLHSKYYNVTKEKMKTKRIGETIINCEGEKLTIIDYKSCSNMSIQFEDGTILEKVAYGRFKTGGIKRPKT